MSSRAREVPVLAFTSSGGRHVSSKLLYVAAWDHEVTDQLKPTRILGEDIVLYRRTDGAVAALEDACPHRKLPLSMGRIKGDTVECGYHGLTFDSTGTCTRVPGAEKIPHVACVRSYPIAERYGLLWI
ncbi:Rieske 2Fe-2S domain-containing protein [Mesorhizobium newzealandense]|uniref:Rieske 2Fe-2S domain-containing protein n=1 Tax=Mesorhizobium newzealandense TaxID=1300302 RepID=A0ABW4UGG8_9HYPH